MQFLCTKTTQIIFLSRIKLSKLFLKELTVGDSWTRSGKSFHLDTDRMLKNCRLISVLGATATRPKASLTQSGCGSVMGLSQHLEHVVKWSWAGPEVESCWAGLGGVRPGWYSGAALAGRDLVSDRRETGQSELITDITW